MAPKIGDMEYFILQLKLPYGGDCEELHMAPKIGHMEYSLWLLQLTHGVDYVKLHMAPKKRAKMWSMEYSIGLSWSEHFRLQYHLVQL